MDASPCAYVGTGKVRATCPALAVPGSRYCAVHRGADRPAVRRPSPAPCIDRDRDVLPWQTTDEAIFWKAVERYEEQRAARRAELRSIKG